jgi:hypothetical protein
MIKHEKLPLFYSSNFNSFNFCWMSWPQNSNSNASSANNSSLSDEELHPVNDSATTNLDIKSAEAWFHRGVALYGQANTMKPFRLSEAYYNK